MKITIECNEKQLGTIKSALDFYSRILMGQFSEIDNFFNSHIEKFWELKNRSQINTLATQMRDIIYPELKGSEHWGIYNPKCPEYSKIAFDIIQCMRHEWIKIKDPNHTNLSFCVDWNVPMASSAEDLIKIQIEE